MDILSIVLALVCVAIGYIIGRHQAGMADRIKSLQAAKDAPKPETPTVILGSYQPPKEVSTAPDERPVGLVEQKTPERLEWENRQAIDKEALGR